MVQPLFDAEQVIDALGGTKAVAILVGKPYRTVWNWRRFDVFPSNTYVILTEELNERGYCAPLALWSMLDPSETVSQEQVLA